MIEAKEKVIPFFHSGYADENSFLITDVASGKSAIIDPCFGDGISVLDGFNISYILLTHGHFDHIAAANAVKECFGAAVLILEADANALLKPELNLSHMFGEFISFAPDKTLTDGDEIQLGKTTIKVLSTPGHTVGSCCYIVEKHIFTGDTVMAGSIGRTDFPTGDMLAMSESINKLKSLTGGNYILHCGHGPDTDLETELRENPFFS